MPEPAEHSDPTRLTRLAPATSPRSRPDLARRIRERIGPGDPEARLAEIDDLLNAIALDAEAVELAWEDV